MYLVTEADAAAIREVYEREGELSADIELRRRFPGILDNVKGAGAGEGHRKPDAATDPRKAPTAGEEEQSTVTVCAFR